MQQVAEPSLPETDSKFDAPSNGFGAAGATSLGYGDDHGANMRHDESQYDHYQGHDEQDEHDESYGPIGIKEDG